MYAPANPRLRPKTLFQRPRWSSWSPTLLRTSVPLAKCGERAASAVWSLSMLSIRTTRSARSESQTGYPPITRPDPPALIRPVSGLIRGVPRARITRLDAGSGSTRCPHSSQTPAPWFRPRRSLSRSCPAPEPSRGCLCAVQRRIRRQRSRDLSRSIGYPTYWGRGEGRKLPGAMGCCAPSDPMLDSREVTRGRAYVLESRRD
jgi:hypothetical protein